MSDINEYKVEKELEWLRKKVRVLAEQVSDLQERCLKLQGYMVAAQALIEIGQTKVAAQLLESGSV